ncbi:MAG: hypothetical protein GEU80_01250 [Dehalococcoidia bacterium]|nr:hypothetical protein [Dehalococcoidia bacterium]
MTMGHNGEGTGVIDYRPNRLFAVLDGRQHVDAAINELAEAGIAESDIDTFSGPDDAQRLDLRRRESRRLEGLRRIFVADESRVAPLYQRAAEDGRYVVRICDRRKESRHRAAAILARHAASTIVDFGRFGYEPIDPAATQSPPGVGPPL